MRTNSVRLGDCKALYEKSKRVDALEQKNKVLSERLDKLEELIKSSIHPTD